MAQKLMTIEASRALDDKPETLWWYYWEAMAGRMPPTHAHYVPVGFFRMDRRSGKSWPVAIWREADGIKRAQVGSGDVTVLSTPEIEAAFAYDTFASICSKPISYETYQFWKENRAWPPTTGAEAAIEKSLQKPTAEAAPERGIGDNSFGPATDHATFVDQVQAALAGLDSAAIVDSDERADIAQSLRSRLSELAGEGDKLRATEKQPHLDASRAVDDKWFPTIREAKNGAGALKKGIEAFANAKLKAERERQAREAAEAERVRQAAAEANKVVVTSGPEPSATPAPADSTPAADKPAPARIGGAYGRATSAKVKKEIDTIDYRAVCDQLVDTNDELRALLLKLANRVIAVSGVMRGVTTRDVAKIR